MLSLLTTSLQLGKGMLTSLIKLPEARELVTYMLIKCTLGRTWIAIDLRGG
jgi:hypothetical protein